jgi:hypothetical protein
MNDAIELAGQPPPMVPQSYAEKAMASLMQLHSDLMEEKERRVDLYRRLMEKEQQLAELKMYVKLLEEKKAEAAPPPVPVQAVTPPPPPISFVERARAMPPRPVVPQPPPPIPRTVSPQLRPVASAAGARPNAWAGPTAEGWRSW